MLLIAGFAEDADKESGDVHLHMAVHGQLC